jgi:hypothetical protein
MAEEEMSDGTSWRARVFPPSVGVPRIAVPWNSGVLTYYPPHALRLVSKYDPPGTARLALVVGFVTAIAAILHKVPLGTVVWVAVVITIASYLAFLYAWKRTLVVDLGDSSDVICDDRNSRIAFLVTFRSKWRWIVVEFNDGFAEASDAICRQFGSTCRMGAITPWGIAGSS